MIMVVCSLWFDDNYVMMFGDFRRVNELGADSSPEK